MKNAVIIGGGLAGLVAAIQLARHGVSCLVIEKNQYPAHKVCGEYVSNEAVPFLNSVNLLPGHFDRFPKIEKFLLSDFTGRTVELGLDPGGFGISRYCFDQHLYDVARLEGVQFLLNTTAGDVRLHENHFVVHCGQHAVEADVVIGAFGKRSRLDVRLQRPFMRKPSPWLAVKYHVETEFPDDTVALHNFQGGYCGVVRVEGGVTNLCYLVRRERLKAAGGVPALEAGIGRENPLLGKMFSGSRHLFDRPQVINEISFETKSPVEHHILMAGDAAGMIAPVCGNGMAMAIHSGKLAADAALRYCRAEWTRTEMEARYAAVWQKHFARRLWAGRHLQRLFAGKAVSRLTVTIASRWRPIAMWLIRQSHGEPF